MLKTKTQKEAELTIKGLRKFIHYKRDLLKPEQIDQLEQLEADLKAARRERDDDKARELMKEVEQVSDKLTPPTERRSGFLYENVEMLFVVIAIMVGIRAYIAQPFKIPTNSMYPTLNGMIAKSVDDPAEVPNFATRTWERLWNGRNYVEIKAPFDSVMMVSDKTSLPLISLASLHFVNPVTKQEEKMTVNTSAGAILSDPGFGLAPRVFKVEGPNGKPAHAVQVREGEVIARGYSQAGDQLLVDKISYHFRKPKRGEVFVFTTKRIPELQSSDPKVDMQHYIKRLVAVPGDQFEVTDDNILEINGKPAEEEGIARVNGAEGEYKGYVKYSPHEGRPYPHYRGKVPNKAFVAMGDNSNNSLDSRAWGYVPEMNLVGPAFAVYFPFGNHFGGVK
ncbi:signal peptidase I [Sulfuriroseicoccus oceanibius]|uniref:Signal peptidase I n=1 Tax=Sulfuriroseicoccus oceanibius TaxID=2707525 RepID=A0A6B3L806_9BACT|nr:signal peptidase I [Sulfuriroseicoccus oceanibius]QQL44139.1 signal peptidase I [Sulfuriroseicoccus oceanibius]